MPLINSLVFLDLEATGLPSLQHPKTVQCTEISLVAVHRRHFIQREYDFRVLNRLNLCINPTSFINGTVAELTGLSNNSLDTQRGFSPTTGRLLNQFLEELEQPICLLAHNGSRFDFPLLKADLTKVGETLPIDILCLDTYDALLELVPSHNDSITPIQNTSTVTDILNNGRIPQNVAETTPTHKRLRYPVYSPNYKKPDDIQPLSQTFPNQNVLTQEAQNKDNEQVLENIIDRQQLPVISTPVKYPVYSPLDKSPPAIINARRTLFPVSKGSTKTVDDQASDDEDPLPRTISTSIPAKRPRTGTTETVTSRGRAKFRPRGYKLKDLYQKFVGVPLSDAHEAEVDAIGLMKVCHQVENFVDWMDEHALLFSDVTSMS